jgi:hypothetical protein
VNGDHDLVDGEKSGRRRGLTSRLLRLNWRPRAGRSSTSTERRWDTSQPCEPTAVPGFIPSAQSLPRVDSGPTSCEVRPKPQTFAGPRFALHAFSPTDVDDEVFVRGRAESTEPVADLKAAIIAAAAPATVGADEEQLFDLHIDRVLVATYTHRGQWPPYYER